MGKETIRDGKWFPEFIMKDLIDVGGLSAKSLGYDVKDLSGRRFFYDKAPFALVTWKAEAYAMVAFPETFPANELNLIVLAFIQVFGYKPFVKYKIFQQQETFMVFEWEHSNPEKKMTEILATPRTKDIEDIREKNWGDEK